MTTKDFGYKPFRSDLTLLQKKHRKKKKKGDPKWIHKDICLEHEITPEIQKHFTNKDIPSKHLKICQCKQNESKLHKEYNIFGRLELIKAIRAVEPWKTKERFYCNLEIEINDEKHCIEILKLKAGAIKRFTQPDTTRDVIATASFKDDSTFWMLGDYVMEIRQKKRAIEQSVNVPDKKNRKNKDVASWWYECWGTHGIKYKTEINKNHKNKNSTKTKETNKIKKKQQITRFIAVHNNHFVGSLHQCFKRLVIYLYKKKDDDDNKDVTAIINGVHVHMPKRRKNINIKNKLNDGSSYFYSQSSCASQSQTISQRSQSPTPSPNHNRHHSHCFDQHQHQNYHHQKIHESWSNNMKCVKDEQIAKLKKENRALKKENRSLKRKNKHLTESLTSLQDHRLDGLCTTNLYVLSPEFPPRKKQKLNCGDSKIV